MLRGLGRRGVTLLQQTGKVLRQTGSRPQFARYQGLVARESKRLQDARSGMRLVDPLLQSKLMLMGYLFNVDHRVTANLTYLACQGGAVTRNLIYNTARQAFAAFAGFSADEIQGCVFLMEELSRRVTPNQAQEVFGAICYDLFAAKGEGLRGDTDRMVRDLDYLRDTMDIDISVGKWISFAKAYNDLGREEVVEAMIMLSDMRANIDTIITPWKIKDVARRFRVDEDLLCEYAVRLSWERRGVNLVTLATQLRRLLDERERLACLTRERSRALLRVQDLADSIGV